MEILNEDTFSMEALNQGTEEVKKEGGFFSSLEEAITNGIELKEMNILLLKKVEELTLHLIQQNKRIEKLEFKNKK